MIVEGFWLRRLAAWGILLLLMLAAYGLVAVPLMERHEILDATAAEKLDMLQDFQRFSANRNSIEMQLRDWQGAESSNKFYLKGDSQPEAVAGLQAFVTALIRKQGATIRSSEALTFAPNRYGDQELARVGLRLQFVARTSELQRILYGLETGTPLLLIDSFEIASRVGGGFVPLKREPPLYVRLEVYGFLRPEA